MSIGCTSLVPSGIDTASSSGVVMPIFLAWATTLSMPTICPRRTNAQFEERSTCEVIVPPPPPLLPKFSTLYGLGNIPGMSLNVHGPLPLTVSFGL